MSVERAIFVATDVKGYSGAAASEHASIQGDLRDAMTAAAEAVGLPVDRWIVQPQGDGALVHAPLEQEARYIDDFVAHLLDRLDIRNRDRVQPARLRMRVALAQGPSSVAAYGFTGEAPILACRLRDASATKRLLADSGADLVLVVSETLYRELIVGGHTRMGPSEFVRLDIDEEKIKTVGWAWFPRGHIPQTLDEARARASEASSSGLGEETAGGGGVHVGAQRAKSIVNMGDGSQLDLTVN